MFRYKPRIKAFLLTSCLCTVLLAQGCIGLIPSPLNPYPGPRKPVQANDLAKAFDITQPVTILHALATAGGPNRETGDLTSVILISKDIHGKPIGRRVDVKRMLDVGDMSSAILAKPYDVIYVPKTYIRDLRVFMDQYVSVVRDFVSLGKTLRPR